LPFLRLRKGAGVKRSQFEWWEDALIVLAVWLATLLGRRSA